jgi:hypothetical protein
MMSFPSALTSTVAQNRELLDAHMTEPDIQTHANSQYKDISSNTTTCNRLHMTQQRAYALGAVNRCWLVAGFWREPLSPKHAVGCSGFAPAAGLRGHLRASFLEACYSVQIDLCLTYASRREYCSGPLLLKLLKRQRGQTNGGMAPNTKGNAGYRGK